jgi:adenylate cyclase
MQRFVSQSTVDMIQTGRRPGAAGERRVMTVLLSDIRGFTAWSERRSPEDAVRLLNDSFSAQAALVRRFSGDIDKYVGDALLAHFAGEDMALHAIRCAVEMQRTMPGLQDAEAHRLALGIGIVTGEVLVGSIGSEERQDYTAIGANVNLCERLCSRAAPGEILMSESTWQNVRDLVAAEPIEGITVKGFSEPVRAYRISVRQDL